MQLPTSENREINEGAVISKAPEIYIPGTWNSVFDWAALWAVRSSSINRCSPQIEEEPISNKLCSIFSKEILIKSHLYIYTTPRLMRQQGNIMQYNINISKQCYIHYYRIHSQMSHHRRFVIRPGDDTPHPWYFHPLLVHLSSQSSPFSPTATHISYSHCKKRGL